MSTLTDTLQKYVDAAFSGIWLTSFEPDEAMQEIGEMCRNNEGWRCFSWDIAEGLRTAEQVAAHAAGNGDTDPVAVLKSMSAAAGMGGETGSTLLVLKNFHKFLQSPETLQVLQHQIMLGRLQRVFYIVLSPSATQIPLELERMFVVIEHELPDREALRRIAAHVATQPGELPEGDELDRVLDASAGLSRFEAEGIFSLAVSTRGKLAPETIWAEKAKSLKKSGLLDLNRSAETFADLGGLSNLKNFAKKLLSKRYEHAKHRPKGILLLGPPGTGKSAFAKALGNEVRRPTLSADLGRLMGSLLGQSQANMRQMLQITDAMSPDILFIDEIEKALAGVSGGSQGDHGTSAQMFGTFLTWMNDHETDAFVICTANDVSKLPPEFSRAERFDAVFFIDLPTKEERNLIWRHYKQVYGLSQADAEKLNDTDWTGAEIKACCRLASLLEVSLTEAALNVVPVAVTSKEKIADLRKWADGRCLSAARPGIYREELTSPSPVKTSRAVKRPIVQAN